MIKKVVLLGAGAIGSYIIQCLNQYPDFYVAASSDRYDQLKKEGRIINGRRISLKVRKPEELTDVDLLIVGVKYNALKDCIDDIVKMVSEKTLVMSLLNGVDSEEIIGERIGMEHMVYSLIKIASRRASGEVNFEVPAGENMGIFYEENDQLEQFFSNTSLCTHPVKDIQKAIWSKFALNISENLPQAVLSCGIEAYQKSEHVAYIASKLREEVILTAHAYGIDLDYVDTKSPDFIYEKNPDARYSTLQDLDAGRPTEIDMFSGTLVRMAEKKGLQTPYNDMIYHLIKALEEKNAGIYR